MKANDSESFREGMSKEIDHFKNKDIFKLISIKDKLKYKSLILFI